MKYPKKGQTNMDNDKQTQPKKVPFDLMAHLGIDSSQVEVNTSTPRASKVILDNKDALQDEARNTIKAIMAKLGTEVSFTCLKRDGTQKDANGKPIKKDGKTVPRFVETKLGGLWVIDERKEGDNTFYEVSRVHYYTEAFTIAEYKEL
tara:strand:+ start:53 stop:496 length:444 start_codon:yes stop_codon:yes gene_type:complete